MNHTIIVRVQADGIQIDHNSLLASPGDSVTWLIEPPEQRGRELQVRFDNVQRLDAGVPIGMPVNCNPQGPFRNLSLGAGLIGGTIHSNPYGGDHTNPRRFLYRLFERGAPLRFLGPASEENTRGIDTPMTPPPAS